LDAPTPASKRYLPLTGERTVPGIDAENYWFRRHEAAYAHLLPIVGHRTVLEVGCGEGYGTALLGARARRIVGLDYDELTVAHARTAYPDVPFVCANLAALPIRSASVDVLASLQVIEHVWDHPQFVRECRRVTRPGGRLLITTPNRLTFSPGRDNPLNPFHTHEFTADELIGLLAGGGIVVEQMLGLHAGSRLHALDDRHGGSFVDAQLAAAPEHWSGELTVDVASVGIADFSVSAEHLDAALDLVLIGRRPD